MLVDVVSANAGELRHLFRLACALNIQYTHRQRQLPDRHAIAAEAFKSFYAEGLHDASSAGLQLKEHRRPSADAEKLFDSRR